MEHMVSEDRINMTKCRKTVYSYTCLDSVSVFVGHDHKPCKNGYGCTDRDTIQGVDLYVPGNRVLDRQGT